MILYAIAAICCFLTGMYLLLLLLYRCGWRRHAIYTAPPGYQPAVMISIIVPARNEAGNLPACLSSLLAQQYPRHLFEIIVVDDHSEDDTAAVAEGVHDSRIRCIRLADHLAPGVQVTAYKKQALAAGIAQSSGELIITTDADCIAPTDWLHIMAACYEEHRPVMIAAPVDFTSNGSLVQVFQSLDFMSMQGITVAAHQLKLGGMSNGANLAFSREAYYKIGGYAGTEHLASGDDFLLMAKMQRAFPKGIYYLKSAAAIIRTAPQPDWRSFLQQRIRWASKSGRYEDTRLTVILLLVYLFNLAFIPAICLGISAPSYGWLPVGMLLVKITVELYYLYPVAGFFEKRRQLWLFPFLQPLHILYILIAGLLGFAGVYQWKGRRILIAPAGSAKGEKIIQGG